MHGRKAFDQTLVFPLDSDWLPSLLYGNAESNTMRFSFVDVYVFCVGPVITGMVRVLGNELPDYHYCSCLVLKLGREALAKTMKAV